MTRVKVPGEMSRPCPVCGMAEVNDDLWRSYRGLKFRFCSQQCLDRFVGYPGLYCGNPKTGLSEKQQGRTQIKRHKIVLSKPMQNDSIKEISRSVRKMMGVTSLDVAADVIYVTYDLMEVSLEDIEREIERVFGDMHSPMIERVKRGWIHYTEECELDNLAHPSKKSGCH